MSKIKCRRRECARIRSEFSLFLNRRRPPTYEGNPFCSDMCLKTHFQYELKDKWHRLQLGKRRAIPRPKLGTILMQTAFLTRDQLDQAVRLQAEVRQGRIGEWLLRLGYVEEHQVSAALARQFGLPLINLKHPQANTEALRLIPGKIARCSNLIPVGFDDSQTTLRVAVSAPVNFNSQEAIRRMVGKGIIAYIGDESAIEHLMEEWYEPEDLDLSTVPAFRSLDDLVGIGNDIINAAIRDRAQDVQAELTDEFFWVRLDFPSETHHHFFRYGAPAGRARPPVPGDEVTGAYAVRH